MCYNKMLDAYSSVWLTVRCSLMRLEHTCMVNINNSLKMCQGKKVLAWTEMDTKIMSLLA